MACTANRLDRFVGYEAVLWHKYFLYRIKFHKYFFLYENSVWSVNTGIYDFNGAIDSCNCIYIGGYGSNLCTSTSNTDWYIKKYSSDGIEQ